MKDQTKTKLKQNRHTPLAKQIEDDSTIKKRVRTGKLAKEKDDITEEEYVSNKLSRKIITEAREQAEEMQNEEAEEQSMGKDESGEGVKGKGKGKKAVFKSFEELMEEDDESTFSEISETESMYNQQDDMTVDEEDEKALAMFMNPTGPTRLLSDIIMEQIQRHEAAINRKADPTQQSAPKEPEIKPEIMQVYYKVGEILSRFTSGKLPKAFRILPSLRNWEQLLYLTRPDRWTAVATRMATMVFSRGMSDKLVQRFYYIILLPKIREEIHEKKKLNFHYYLALKKSLYRPGAFFRGILLPLCESGDCTLREATVIGSVIKKVSIPAIHSSVALYKICQMPYFGANQYFMQIFINKKYSLPYKVIDAVYEYFMNFMDEERKLPALWHRTLLTFAQRYKGDMTSEQKEHLQKLTTKHPHPSFTAEVRRELFSVKGREISTTSSSSTAGVPSSTETSKMDM